MKSWPFPVSREVEDVEGDVEYDRIVIIFWALWIEIALTILADSEFSTNP